jgi:D-proline reductase (dithiol) PrdB
VAKPLGDCRVALVSSAGIARHDQPPFDQELERRDPWWSDQSWRPIPAGTSEADVGIYHLHIDPRFGHQDLDCVLPLRRLQELSAAGLVGQVAATHYSFMGYILQPRELLACTVPAIAARWPRRRWMSRCWCRCDRSVAGRSDWSSESSRLRALRRCRCR